VKCLTLLGTAGEEEAWNSRRRSEGHRAIPLPSAEVVERFPMISQLVRQLGLELPEVVAPDPDLIVRIEEKTCSVFYLPEAAGSPFIPAQTDFVAPYGVKTVIGFGGVMPSGNLFAIILFSRVRVPREKAEVFRILAVSVQAALVPFDFGPVRHERARRSGSVAGATGDITRCLLLFGDAPDPNRGGRMRGGSEIYRG
jgi:two-component system NtrC family sensor kinase